jgi:hypothetical protein
VTAFVPIASSRTWAKAEWARSTGRDARLDRLVAIKEWGIGAEALHEPKGLQLEFGIVRTRGDAGGFGARVDQNPLQNLMVLDGTGHLRLNDTTGRNQRVGGVRYTIKDGIVYDVKQLLADVAAMVEAQKRGTTSQ